MSRKTLFPPFDEELFNQMAKRLHGVDKDVLDFARRFLRWVDQDFKYGQGRGPAPTAKCESLVTERSKREVRAEMDRIIDAWWEVSEGGTLPLCL